MISGLNSDKDNIDFLLKQYIIQRSTNSSIAAILFFRQINES